MKLRYRPTQAESPSMWKDEEWASPKQNWHTRSDGPQAQLCQTTTNESVGKQRLQEHQQ